ncbi:MAG: hypothetical protein J0L66_03310 [Cytophagales bacterium]|nr:hypothetical protein [Cytophagales bacterium]
MKAMKTGYQSVIKIVSFSFLIMVLTTHLFGQGCSDAGFCTLNSFKPHADSLTFTRKLKAGINFGSADNSINIFGSYFELNQRLTTKLSADVKITTLSQSGNGISVFNLSDLFLNFNYSSTSRFTLSAGVKLPLADGNKEKNNLPLPMDYQSSLGTVDLIVGAGYLINRWQFVWAYQQPLTQNKNRFLAEQYPANSPLQDFQSTNKFEREGDMLLRISYPMPLGKSFSFTPSLLPIYHLRNDKYTDATGIVKEIANSKGLTLNATLYFDFAISKASSLQLNMGTPLVVRDARPDGLTRSLIVNLEYMLRF